MSEERSPDPAPFGSSRVLEPLGQLPQNATRLDNQGPPFKDEICIQVDCLNIDSASFNQMVGELGAHPIEIGKAIESNCKQFGKQHNQVTGSGGMLMGKVAQLGSLYPNKQGFKIGDRVATLVSLTLTPLEIKKIKHVNIDSHQVEVDGVAYLPPSALVEKLPTDMDDTLALSVMDVAGAPALLPQHVKREDTAVVLGAGGKAGLLCCQALREIIGPKGRLIAVEPFEAYRKDLEGLAVCDMVLNLDATSALDVHAGVHKATHGKMGDVVVSVTPVANTEMGALLSGHPNSNIIFYGMATSFSQVTLGAEGVGVGANLIFGNGYTPNHVAFAFGLLRRSSSLREVFLRRYAK